MNEIMDYYLGSLLDDRYELQSIIGEGGMAKVYRARCNLLNRNVAVKILKSDVAADEEFREHFKTEARAVAMLSHPNIVAVYDVSRDDNPDYIVMELVDGITLKQYIKAKGSVPINETIHLSRQIAKALSHAHSKGIIHRDIKPQNVLLTVDGIVKVADFGIAHLEQAAGSEASMGLGSLNYTSPELLRGATPDAAGDVYALGISMFEMLTGALPYMAGADAAETLARISMGSKGPMYLNPDVPEGLNNIVVKAMNPDPEKRYSSAQELLDDLDAFKSDSAEAPSHVDTPDGDGDEGGKKGHLPGDVVPIARLGELSKERFRRRHARSAKISILLGVGIVLALIVFIWIYLWNGMLKDIFSEDKKLTIPDFTGKSYLEIIGNDEFKELFNFSISYEVDPVAEKDFVISQEPKAEKQISITSDKIEVSLKVSTGSDIMVPVPDVAGMDYKEAVTLLQKQGFTVREEYAASDTVTEDIVIGTSPAAEDMVSAGAIVYVTISSGKAVVTIEMPKLTGFTEAVAKQKIIDAGLSVGTSTSIESETPAGIVVWQSTAAGTLVEKNTKIYLQVSTGPAEKPEETPAAGENDNNGGNGESGSSGNTGSPDSSGGGNANVIASGSNLSTVTP